MPSGIYIRTEQYKKKQSLRWMGDKNPMKRKEVREKTSKSLKGQHNSLSTEFQKGHKVFLGSEKGYFKKGSLGFNRNHTRFSKEKMSKTHTGKKLSEKTKRKIGIASGKRKHLESSKNKIREWHIAHPNKNFKDTSIELKVEAELQKRGIVYKKQIPLCKITVADFYIPIFNIVIQCDGCYWHNCSTHWPNAIEGRTEKDINKDLILRSNGYKVYRFWEHEINESTKKCIDRLDLKDYCIINKN